MLKSKYKVGDKVYIRDDLSVNKIYKSNSKNTISVVEEMLDVAGKVAKILKINYKGDYIINIGPIYKFFSDDMIDHEKTLELKGKKELGAELPYLSDSDAINVVAETMYDLAIGKIFNKEKDLDKYDKHNLICQELNDLYRTKNIRYDDAFSKSFNKYGLTMPCIRLEDKIFRFIALAKDKKLDNQDNESIIDTLNDLANYAIMTRIEIENLKYKEVINTMQNKVKEEVGE